MDFINLPQRRPKPRCEGLTVVADQGLGLSQVEDCLEPWGEYIDACKFYHLTPALLPRGFIDKKIELYRKHDVAPMVGGICLELAHCQGKTDETIRWIADTGFQAIEISENFVDFSLDEKTELIERCTRAALEVFYEYGDKYYDPERQLTVAEVADSVLQAKNMGASHTIIEESVVDLWLGKDGLGHECHKLVELADLVGRDHLIWEAGGSAQNAQLVQLLGPEVNLGPNLPPGQVMWLEAGRRGLGRTFGYRWVVDEYERFRRRRSDP